MILCENLGKSYGSNEVLKDFSYSFGDNGFYLLFGPSGSGKTTLINIICGVLAFEEGTVLIDEEIFSGTPHWDMVRDKIGYVTQQVHFVDYLTVRENLLLASADDNAIQELLMKYGLYNRLNDFPAELSVGERQRIAIIQEVLTNKEILLLDEPTASLDPENKLIVFEMLKELSKKKCVICSSHDKQAKNYADDIINFKDISINGMTKESTQDILNSVSKKEKSVQKKLSLSYFTRKWFSYKGRAKGAKIVLNIILILSIIAVLLGDTYNHKLESNLKNFYKANHLTLYSKDLSKNFYDNLKNTSHVMDVSLLYNRNIPYDKYDDSVNAFALTIPFDSEAFLLSNNILYGKYFEHENQIILPYEAAVSLTRGQPQNAIGRKMKVNLFDGEYDFSIVGVFDKFTDRDIQYFSIGGIDLRSVNNENIFISSKFAERYINSEFLSENDVAYSVYFDSYKSMSYYAEQFDNAKNDGDIEVSLNLTYELQSQFYNLFIILSPLSALMIFVAVLFYLQNQRVEAGFMSHIFAVYQHHGYSYQEIRKAWIKDNLHEIVKLLLYSYMEAFIFSIVFNIVNETVGIFEFRVFTFNALLLAALAVLIVFTTIIVSYFDLHKLKVLGWNSLLTQECDLL